MNDLKSAEKCLSQALKNLSTSTGSSYNKEKGVCFHTMAEICLIQATQQSDDDAFCEILVRGIALYEAEQIYKYGAYKEDKDIEECILAAEVNLISKMFGPDGVDRFNKMTDTRTLNRKKLEEIRLKLTNEYFPSLDKYPDWNSENVQKRCVEIEMIYAQIHNEMKEFLNSIFLFCMQIAGPTPCNFSIIGLGSLARKELTPYSDLEFAILLDDNNANPSPQQRQYFRFLTYFIHTQIIKLGETILPSMGIPSLNDFYSKNKEDDWFFDDVIPRGFSFDGMMPWACKTPLGKKEWRGQPRQEYIMTIDEMLELQNVNPTSSIESLKTANVFSSACHLFGDVELTAKYLQRLSTFLTHADRMKSFRQQVFAVMESLLEMYGSNEISTKDFGTQQDVKKEVYRLTSLLVEQLLKFFGIFGQSSWQGIQEMCRMNIFTEEGAQNLLTALSITTELRLRCYQQQGMQKDALPTIPQLSLTEDKNCPCPSTAAIVRLYQTLIPLTSVMSSFLQEIKDHDSCEPELFVVAVLKHIPFNDVSALTTAVAYLRILQLPKAFECLLAAKDGVVDKAELAQITLVLASCYQMVGKFQEVIECAREVEAMYATSSDILEGRVLVDALSSIMDAYMSQGVFQEAAKIYDQIITLQDQLNLEDSSPMKKIDFLHSGAVLYIKLKQYKNAESILKSIIKTLPNKNRDYFNYFLCLNNLAVILLNQDKLQEARSILNTALEAASQLYGENAAHPYFARCLLNLSEVYYELGEIEEADRVLQRALIICSHVDDQNLIEPSIVDALIRKARIHEFYKQWDDMFDSLYKAKEIAEVLYKGQPHPNMAEVLYNVAFCEQKRGNSMNALHHYQNFLKMYEEERMECQQGDYNCTIANVLLRITHLGEKCSCDVSYLISCHEKALEIEEKVHGKESDHAHLAMCFESFGYLLIRANQESKGLEYLGKAMKMFEQMNFHNKHFYGYAQAKTGEILGEHSPFEAEAHLKKAKSVLKKTVSDESDITLLQINSFLLNIYIRTNRIQEGFELAKEQRRLIEIMLSRSTVPSIHDMFQLYQLALYYETSGRRNTAKEIYISLITCLQEQVKQIDPKEGDIMFILLMMTEKRVGDIYRAHEMFYNAEAMYQRIRSSVESTTLDHPFVKKAHQCIICHLAWIYTQTGRYPEAYELLDDFINKYEDDPKFTDTETASSVYLVRGDLNRLCSRFNLALLDLEKAAKLTEQSQAKSLKGRLIDQNKVQYAQIMNTIGLVYEKANDLKRALEYYLCCLSIVESEPLSVETASFHQNAADIFKQLGKLEDALVHYRKSLEIREILHSEDLVREDIATVLYHIAVTQFLNNRPKDASKTLEKLIPLRIDLLKKNSCEQNYCAALTLKGNCHIMQTNEAQQAKECYKEVEKILRQRARGPPNLDYARVISNIGECCIALHCIYVYVVLNLFLLYSICVPIQSSSN